MIAKSYMNGQYRWPLEYLRRAKELHYPDLSKVYRTRISLPLAGSPLAKIVKR